MRHRGVFVRYHTALLEELQGGEISQCLVGAYCVVGFLPLEQFLVEFCRDPRALCDLIEFLGMGSLCPLDCSVELGAFWGEHKEADSPLVAGLFKVGMEFRSPIYLESPDGKGHAGLHGIQKLGGQLSSGATVHFKHIPTGDHIAGGELFEGDTW